MTATPSELVETTTAAPDRNSGRFPWYVLAGAIVLQGATAPGQTVGISVFVDHFASDLDLSRSAVSSAYLLGTLSGALTMPAAGRLIDRRGVRTATLLFGSGFGAVLIAMAGVTGFVTLAIGFAGTRILGQGALTLTATTTVAIWFDERRGFANGIKAAAGSGLMSLVPIGSAALIALVGWRTSWIVLGLAAWAIVLPLGRWLIRDPRHDHDPATDDFATDTTRADAARTRPRPPAVAPAPSWPVRDVVRHPAFLAMTGAAALAALIGTGLMFHHIDLLTGQGLSTTEAAAAFLPLTIAGAVAALAAGRVADQVSPRLLTAIALVVLGASPVLVQTIGSTVTAAAYGAALGASGAAIRTIEATALPRWFGIATIGQIRGVVMAAGVGASAVGPLIVSLGLDLFDSYTPVLNALGAVSVLLAVATMFVSPPTGGAREDGRDATAGHPHREPDRGPRPGGMR
ncbi:MFS transporter [Acidimicrobiia bacterium EGI L10123]|uniref:MFS transporter n=1 Tax=Salinilacustrithrix flava TaxID=2957203 RepID=UPI003D7C1CC5|nr:MFS transporter [Acidimicrobiia bacterium EGI L10123]